MHTRRVPSGLYLPGRFDWGMTVRGVKKTRSGSIHQSAMEHRAEHADAPEHDILRRGRGLRVVRADDGGPQGLEPRRQLFVVGQHLVALLQQGAPEVQQRPVQVAA